MKMDPGIINHGYTLTSGSLQVPGYIRLMQKQWHYLMGKALSGLRRIVLVSWLLWCKHSYKRQTDIYVDRQGGLFPL